MRALMSRSKDIYIYRLYIVVFKGYNQIIAIVICTTMLFAGAAVMTKNLAQAHRLQSWVSEATFNNIYHAPISND